MQSCKHVKVVTSKGDLSCATAAKICKIHQIETVSDNSGACSVACNSQQNLCCSSDNKASSLTVPTTIITPSIGILTAKVWPIKSTLISRLTTTAAAATSDSNVMSPPSSDGVIQRTAAPGNITTVIALAKTLSSKETKKLHAPNVELQNAFISIGAIFVIIILLAG